ncbi:MAG TPA: 50S ribosomal protein L17 [Firmicutes bacterium]|nr:50S ribosomal protein L17 [Bacillota bacterium]HBK67928.1 50S ribosomal protein L17 [Bacillota bacterium]HBT17406.1 50S ribosomal protein L17 [Bacillota bacterium]
MTLRRLGRPLGHRKALFRNMVTDLLTHGKIETTEVKAKELRMLAENLITWGKQGDIHARRQVAMVISDKDVVKKLFNEIATRYTERNGGYTRIVKLGPRRGDAAPMALIELV